MNAARRAWLRLDRLLVVVYRFPGSFLGELPEGARQVDEYAPLIDEYGDEVTLTFVQGRQRFSVNLTNFTAQELLAFENFITATIARARPVTIARDRIVQEVYDEQGDDSFTRLYRTVPELYVRKGEVGQYSTGVQRGPQDAAEVPGTGYVVTPVLGVVDRQMAERDARDLLAADDGAEADLAAGVQPVGKGEEESPF